MAAPSPSLAGVNSDVALGVFNASFSNFNDTFMNQTNSTPSLAPTLPPLAPTLPPFEFKEFFVDLLNQPTMAPNTTQIQPATELKYSPELTSLGFTLGISTAILSGILFSFALAMRLRNTHIAPRCEARPREVIYNPDPMCDPSQNKGNPFLLGWVWWVLNLSYKELLEGVPGTGTRKGGLKGKLLTVNLDHIILLRFNALGLKISLIASIVYLTICLPIYFYSRCPWVPLGEINVGLMEDVVLNCTNEQNYTFSSYVRFTLANVPDLADDFFSKDYRVESFLFYMISIASWVVVWFACFELFHEWIDEVAIRRVYYLEYNHWQAAKEELKKTMLDAVQPYASRRHTSERMHPEEHLFKRDIWIPHPEQRDTPSNIELYSVLVGGIPNKPNENMHADDIEEAVRKDSSQVDWQMELVSTFFDSCVPNMPGYTSSVAAVTILPSAMELAMAWSSWYKAAKKLSRLRFIRKRIIELGGTPVGQKLVFDKDFNQKRKQRKDVGDAARRRDYSAEVLGAGIEDDANDEFWKSLDLGPEQIAVYSMEFSSGLAGCCPHGFCEQRISYCKDLDFLLELEADAADAVTAAYGELKAAGALAATSHEKRKDLMKLAKLGKLGKLGDFTGNLIQPLFEQSVEFPEHFKSTTEMQLMKRRRKQEESMHSASGKSLSEHADEMECDGFGSESKSRIAAAQLDSMVGAQKEKEPWRVVETIAFEAKNNKRKIARTYEVQNGKWSFPTPRRVLRGIKRKITSLLMWTSDNSNEATDLLARDTTFAVVTFTSRQAAIAARQCLADGRGAEAFTTTPVLPVPPLADSAAFNACDFRGCTKPVTIGLNEYQKSWRKTTVTIAVAFIYVFYTYPISQVSLVASNLVWLLIPKLPLEFTTTKAAVEGWLEAQILGLFLAFLPDLFLFLANFGSNATSMVEAENNALRFYWFFMVCFAMVGSSIFKMGQEVYYSGSLDIADILQSIARTIPVDVSFTWTNWIITRATTFTPAFYLLQLNTYIFAAFGRRCCVRMFRGGGAGNRLPYRIYVENGTVLLCSLALAPAAPLLSPFAVLYFLICTPLLRFVVIFTYKPPFDSGGSRWPELFDMIITSLVVAQTLLSTMLFLKKAAGASIFAFVPVFPILLFRRRMRGRFLAAFNDAALLQTSMLDGWDLGSESEQLSFREREEFRRFLVDAHKAAFVPICIAATSVQNNITAEPAEVIWKTEEEKRQMETWANEIDITDRRELYHSTGKKSQQFGALNRRHLSSLRDLSTTGGDTHLGTRLTPQNNAHCSTPSHGPPPAVIVEAEQSEEESNGREREPDSGAENAGLENLEVVEVEEHVEKSERCTSVSSIDESTGSPPAVLTETSETPSVRVTRLAHFFPSPTGEMAYEFTFNPGNKKED